MTQDHAHGGSEECRNAPNAVGVSAAKAKTITAVKSKPSISTLKNRMNMPDLI